MALIDTTKRLTATIPLEYRPEDTMMVKVQFLEADGTTPYDMSKYNFQLTVYAPTVATSFGSNLINKVADGTEQGSKVVALRQSRDNQGNDMFPNENGIFLDDETNSIYTIEYGKEEGVVFLVGEYFMTLSARLEHGQWKSLLSFKVRFHNEIVDLGTTIQGINFIQVPLQRTELSTYLLPIQNLL